MKNRDLNYNLIDSIKNEYGYNLSSIYKKFDFNLSVDEFKNSVMIWMITEFTKKKIWISNETIDMDINLIFEDTPINNHNFNFVKRYNLDFIKRLDAHIMLKDKNPIDVVDIDLISRSCIDFKNQELLVLFANRFFSAYFNGEEDYMWMILQNALLLERHVYNDEYDNSKLGRKRDNNIKLDKYLKEKKVIKNNSINNLLSLIENDHILSDYGKVKLFNKMIEMKYLNNENLELINNVSRKLNLILN